MLAAPDRPQIAKLFADERWNDVVDAGAAVSVRTPDLEYYVGVALAHLGRLREAEEHLLAGHRLGPGEQRFAIELGGLAFKQQRLSDATRWLRRAARINPGDAYTNNFLGTVYFLQGNIEAALKYWNRAGGPEVSGIDIEPGLRTDPVLLDRAFTFAPGSTLLRHDFRTSKVRIAGLEAFSNPQLRLEGRADGTFGLRFTGREKNGWGAGGWQTLVAIGRGLPYQAIHPEYWNIGGRTINFTSMVRWDPQKRRVRAAVSSPLGWDPRYRLWAELDGRDEKWELRSASLGRLGLRRYAVSAGISSFRSAQWRWSSVGELSHRSYRDVASDAAAVHSLTLDGYQLKHSFNIGRDLWCSPEHRVESGVEASLDTARLWAGSSHLYQKVQLSTWGRWLPGQTGDDYAVHGALRTGHTFGQLPFDELFILGLERDNELLMRGHVGTHDGRKGSAPMGRSYAVANWEVDKNLYNDGLVVVKLSPFLDVGKIINAASLPVTRKWLWDAGIQAKVAVLGVGFTITYGKDLRTGSNVLYVSASR